MRAHLADTLLTRLQRIERCDRRTLAFGRLAEVERALRCEPLDLNQRLQIHFRFRRDRPAEPGLHRTQLLRVFAQPLFDFAEPAGDHAVFARGRV